MKKNWQGALVFACAIALAIPAATAQTVELAVDGPPADLAPAYHHPVVLALKEPSARC